MRPGTDANESRQAAGRKPYAMLGAGRLTATLWKEGNEHAGWQYRFNLFRMSRNSGRVSQRFLPRDVPDLARLAQLLAFTLSDDGCLDSELRDDLSCLAACLDQVLPSTAGSGRPRPRPWGAVERAIREVLDYLLDDEKEHFAQSPSPGHIYRQLLLLDRWLSGVEGTESLRLDRVDAEAILSSDGGCPLCGGVDEIVGDACLRWAVCHAHQVRWCIGEREEINGAAVGSQPWQRIREYLIVAPLRRTDESTERNR